MHYKRHLTFRFTFVFNQTANKSHITCEMAEWIDELVTDPLVEGLCFVGKLLLLESRLFGCLLRTTLLWLALYSSAVNQGNTCTYTHISQSILIKHIVQCKSKNHPPPCGLRFSDIFHKRLRILNQLFKHILHVPVYARLKIFIQLSPTLTKLCHIKRDYLVHIICSKCRSCIWAFDWHQDRRPWMTLMRYDTIEELNVDSKAEYSALSSTLL